MNLPRCVPLLSLLLVVPGAGFGAAPVKPSKELSAAVNHMAEAFKDEIIKASGNAPEDDKVTAFLTTQKVAVDSPIGVETIKRVAAHREIIALKVADPGTELFQKVYAQMIGTAPANVTTSTGAAVEPVNPFTSPSQRFVRAKAMSDLYTRYQDALARNETPAPATRVTRDQIPFVSDFGTHAMLGVRLLSPYTIQTRVDDAGNPVVPTVKTLESSSSDANPYFEFIFSNRWAWRDERIANTRPEDQKGANDRHGRKEFLFGKKKFLQLDGDIRIGYTFGAESKDNAAQIVGSGQFNADALLGVGLLRGEFDGGAYSFNLELGGGIVTDASSFNSNSRMFTGVGFTSQLPGFLGYGDARQRPTLVSARFGIGWWELPQYANETTRELLLKNGDVVDFDLKSGGALEVEVFLPFRENSFINLGGKIYATDPDVWTLNLGVTTNLQALFESLSGGK